MKTDSLHHLLDSLYRPSSDGILVLRLGSEHILYANPALHKMLEYENKELQDLHLSEIFPTSGFIFKDSNSESDSGKIHWEFAKKSGEPLPVDFTINMVEDLDAELLLLHIYDRSEHRMIEMRLQHLQKMLQSFRDVKSILTKSGSERMLLQRICDVWEKDDQSIIVWGFYDKDEDRNFVVPSTLHNTELQEAFEDQFKTSIETPMKRLIESQETLLLSEISHDHFSQWYSVLNQTTPLSSISLVIKESGSVIAGLEILSEQSLALDDEEIALYRELAEDIRLALRNIKIEAQRIESLRQLKFQGALLNAIEIPMLSTDEEGYVTYCNHYFEQFIGKHRSTLMDKPVKSILPLKEEWTSQRLLQGHRSEFTVTKSDGNDIPMLLVSSTLRDDYGHMIGMIIILFDITEQKKNEELIRASEAKLRNLFAAMNNGIVIVDPEGIVIEVAPILKFFLFQFLNVQVGDNMFELLPQTVVRELSNNLREAVATQRVHYTDFSIELLEEENFYSVKLLPMKKYQDVENPTMLIFSDVTQTRLLDKQLYETAKFVSIGELAAGIAHEINNPLQSSLLYLEDLIENDEPDEAERRKIYQRVEAANIRIKDLIRGLLDLGRSISKGKELISPYYILMRASELIEASCNKNKIELQKHVSPDLPQIRVTWQEIEQVLINCMVNAINAISEMEKRPAHPQIKISLTKETFFQKEWIVFTVEDNGPGMTQKVQDQAFLPLFTTRRSKQGTGLGLAISKRIITEHGGDIVLESEKGKGTIVSIRLPL